MEIVLSSLRYGIISGSWVERVHLWRFKGVIQCLPIIATTFCCHPQVLPTYDSLDEPSVKRMSTIFTSALNVVTIFYITVGFFGYVSFTENIAGNVLMNFPSNLVTEMIRVGFMMSVAVGFPMMILPCRQAINTMLFEQQQKDGTFAAGGYMPPLRFKAITLCIVFGTMLGGILIPNVETILGLTGATMGSLICFICPALIYRKIQKNGIIAQLVLWVGLGILLVSTLTTLSISARSPGIKVQAPPPPAPDKNNLLPDLPDLHDNPANKKPVEIEKPDVPAVEVASLCQRGRPIATEPPIPHDEVKVDTRNLEPKEEKKPPVEEPQKDEEQVHVVKVENKRDNSAEEKPKPAEAGQSNEVVEKPVADGDKKQDVPALKKVEKLDPVKNPLPGNGAALENQAVGAKVDSVIKAPDAAGKLAVPEGEHHAAAAEEAPAADSKDTADEKLDEGQLDHAVLLQVIKEQQEQQKRLLDQQEKLLAVIEEQHKEIHQKQPAGAAGEGEPEKSNQEQEGGAAKPKEQPKEGVGAGAGVGVGVGVGAGAGAGAGAPQGGVAEPHAVAQNQAQAGDNIAKVEAPKVAVQAAYKEDVHGAAVAESHRQSELGARGVPLGKKRPDDHQVVAQNDQVAQPNGEERGLDSDKENQKKEQIKKEVQARLEELEREKKEKVAREQELARLEKEKIEKEKIEKEVQARVEKERLERERQEKLERERIEKEVQARVEKERLERERREKLAREEELEKERLAQEKAAEEKQIDNEIVERARKEKNLEETRERLAQLERDREVRNAAKAAQGGEREDLEPLKNGGRDLKEKAVAQADPREGVRDKAVKAEAHPQGSPEKVRDQGEMDLRRRRRALGPGEAGGPPEENGGTQEGAGAGASAGAGGLRPACRPGGAAAGWGDGALTAD
ncbi:Putative sodium-coupled neutral amino acid transporter 10 [Larimichthys crocea]|uniref:Uncharacterized protein n=1 Tax=Larimichthys crocea TaxID=215358 RepID=A0ACD3RRF0_LARCR|nr:Putative sodium-coupled neutral amino acid transporter 10 [Larimichthys crocea]